MAGKQFYEDPYRLDRFIDAQKPVWTQVRGELAEGEKRSHWMWFIFPQIRGLGSSFMAQRFAISGMKEARAYLAHPLLGKRLRECTSLVNGIRERTINEIFGSPDDLKFRSSMTLFDEGARSAGLEGAEVPEAIAQPCGGVSDEATLHLLRS